MFKVNNKDTRNTSGLFPYPLKTSEYRRCLAFFISFSNVSIANFEHAIAGWKRNINLKRFSVCHANVPIDLNAFLFSIAIAHELA